MKSLFSKFFLSHWLSLWFGLFFLSLAQSALYAQSTSSDEPPQAGVKDYSFNNTAPAWPSQGGPKLMVDQFVSPYVQRGAFEAFKALAETDGYQFSWNDVAISTDILASINTLVVANAYTKGGDKDYELFSTLDAPSVYSDEQISEIANWVQDGGNLLILADHSPFAGGTIKLAEKFGFTYMTGFAISKDSLAEVVRTNIDFRLVKSETVQGTLNDHAITNGSTGRPAISHFMAFGGQAIIPPPEAKNLLVIPENFETLLTFRLQEDFRTAPRMDATGFSQGATLEFGKGRVAIFGETGGFTSQSILGAEPFGLSDPRADQNADFVLSVLRWLNGYKPG